MRVPLCALPPPLCGWCPCARTAGVCVCEGVYVHVCWCVCLSWIVVVVPGICRHEIQKSCIFHHMRNDCASVRCHLIYLESCRCECVCLCMFVCVPVCSNRRGYISTWIKKSCIFHHMRSDRATVRAAASSIWNHAGVNVYVCVCMFECLWVLTVGVTFRHEL